MAEHQPGSVQACRLRWSRLLPRADWVRHVYEPLDEREYFIILYALTAYYFASKMSRLVILGRSPRRWRHLYWIRLGLSDLPVAVLGDENVLEESSTVTEKKADEDNLRIRVRVVVVVVR